MLSGWDDVPTPLELKIVKLIQNETNKYGKFMKINSSMLIYDASKKKKINPLSAFKFKFLIKICKKFKKWKGENQAQVYHKEWICKKMSISCHKIHRFI